MSTLPLHPLCFFARETEIKRKRGRPRKNEVPPKNVSLQCCSIEAKKKKRCPRKDEWEPRKGSICARMKEMNNKDKNQVKKYEDEIEGIKYGKSGSKKFDHVFIYGFDSIAVDRSELHKLIKKVIRAKFRMQKYDTLEEGCLNYKTIICPEQIAMDKYFFFVQSRVHSGEGDKLIDERLFGDFEITDIVSLALEGLKEVPKTWKNAHAIFITVVKVLEDMWEGVERLELQQQKASLIKSVRLTKVRDQEKVRSIGGKRKQEA